ncbi:hypothetical protein BN871_KI_00020 [Paenibacillus sp. P22]|nr:hypothetical protein BN871_KI_00020 [Paenibacillus sp. P22]
MSSSLSAASHRDAAFLSIDSRTFRIGLLLSEPAMSIKHEDKTTRQGQ